jgi:ribosomal-protein-alanine N-acetyltransferase
MSDSFPQLDTDAEALAWLNIFMNSPTHFAIETDDDGVVGGIGGSRLKHERAHAITVGYWLGNAFWGRGIATEALRAFADDVFAFPDVLRIESSVYSPNVGSIRVLEKAGFEREGVQRCAIIRNGETLDNLLFARHRKLCNQAQPCFSWSQT